MVKLVTDSTADVPPALAPAFDIRVIPAILELDGQTYYDAVTIERSTFYKQLPAYTAFPKTAAASPGTFADVYRDAARAGATDIISIHLSPKFSSMGRSAVIAAEDVAGEGIRVHTVDSRGLSLGVGFLVLHAAELAQQGLPAAEIVTRLEAYRERIRLYVMFDTLKNLRKGGRVSALTAGLGDLLQVKLMVDIRDDEFKQLDKVRTRGRGLERLIDTVRSQGPCDKLAIIHAGEIAADVALLQSRLADRVPTERQLIVETTPALGAHTGLAAIGVALVKAQP
jgi:DegV family protein with EDD domain